MIRMLILTSVQIYRNGISYGPKKSSNGKIRIKNDDTGVHDGLRASRPNFQLSFLGRKTGV